MSVLEKKCQLQSILTSTSLKSIICTKKMRKGEGASFFSCLNSENAAGPLCKQRRGVFTLKSLKLGEIKNEFLVIKVSLKVFVKKD